MCQDMAYPKTKRPFSSKLLVALEIFYGILGLISGSLLISDPTGGLLGFTADIRDKIPFQTFLPVGLFLFFVYGVGSLVLAYGAMTRKELFLEKISQAAGHHWSWFGGMLLTVVLVIWLAVEGSLIGLDWPATYFTVLIGVGIFIMLILPSTKAFYKLTR
jgi:hypothetical protein